MDNPHIARLLVRHAHRQGRSSQKKVYRERPAGLSIAISSWNHELVLPRAIYSAMAAAKYLNQLGVSTEVLVVDDESRDGTLTMLRQLEALYYQEGLRVLAFAHNQGLAEVRNHALYEAQYRHILFLDSDNELVAENVPIFYRSICMTQAAVVYGNLLRKEIGSEIANLVVSNEAFQSYMFEWSIIDACALYDSLQILDAGGFASSSEISLLGEEWELYLHLAVSGKLLVFVPVVFAIYYVNPRSMFLNYKARDPDISLVREYIRRVFDQFGIRQQQPLNTIHRRYHPDIGYI